MIVSNIVATNILDNYCNPKDYGIIGFIQKPNKRMVKANVNLRHVSQKLTGQFSKFQGSFFLSFPYVFFRIIYHKNENNRFYFYKNGLSVALGVDENVEKIFRPPMPNIFNHLGICFPVQEEYFSDIESMCNSCVRDFWASEFSYTPDNTYDFSHYYSGNRNSQYSENSIFSDYNQWAKKTKENPDWIPGEEEILQCYSKDSFFGYSKECETLRQLLLHDICL